MKELFERYTFPALVAVMLLGIICSLGVIHWNRSDLAISKTLDIQIRQERTVLAGLKEKIQALQEREAVFQQKKASADISRQESEKSLAELNKRKLEAERQIAKAASLQKEEQIAAKNLKDLQANIISAQMTLADLKKQQQQLSNLKEQIKQANLQRLELKSDLEKLQKEQQNLNIISEKNRQLNSNFQKRSLEYKTLNEAVARLQGEKQILLKQSVDLQKQNASEEKRLNLFLKKIEDLQEYSIEATAKQKNIELLSTQLQKLQKKNTALESEKAVLLREVAQSYKQFTSLQKEIELAQQVKAELAIARAKNRDFQQENLQLQTAISTQKKTLLQISAEVAQKQSELELAKQNLLDIKKQQETARRKK